jgi:hypothetical protein
MAVIDVKFLFCILLNNEIRIELSISAFFFFVMIVYVMRW